MDMFGTSPISNLMIRDGKPHATLMLYTPKQYGTHVLRPYVYGFDGKVVDKLMGAGDSLMKAIQRPDVANSEEIANVIKPAYDGAQVNMSVYDMMWTFLLVISQPNNYGGTTMSANGYKTSIFAGHCTEEPINPLTMHMSAPTVNPNCGLVIHSRQILNSSVSGGMMGAIEHTTVQRNDDVLDPSIDQNVLQNLFVMTPFNTLSNTQFNGTADSSASTPGMCALCNAQRTPTQMALKTPGVHLKQILQGVESQMKEVSMAEVAPSGLSGIGMMESCDDIEAFTSGLESKLSWMACDGRVQTDGIDVTGVVTIGYLDTLFAGNMKVWPMEIPVMSQYRDPQTQMAVDIIPQTNLSPKVLYSTFIANAVSALASDSGLSSISFGYTSYVPSKKNDLDPSLFQVMEACLTCPPPTPDQMNAQLASAVELFRMQFQSNVAPFVTGTNGHFHVFVTYSITSETMVDLQFLDNNQGSNYGVFESANRLSTLSSPILGTEDQFISNGQSLHNLALQVQGRTSTNALGIPAFRDVLAAQEAPVTMPDPSGMGAGMMAPNLSF